MSLVDQQPPIIAPEQIAKLIGEARFNDIRQQLEGFKIRVEAQTKQAIEAEVEGFQTKVVYRNNNVEGACNCPESDGFDFCIHCAALCLHANRNTQQIASLAKGPDKSRVLAYLLGQDKQKLAKEFLSLLSNDNELFERYLLRASLHQEEIDYGNLKSQITDLTRNPEKLFSQRQVKHFFAKIERFIEELDNLEHYPDPDKMLKLLEHMHQRLSRLLDSLDDNTGQRNDCVSRFRKLYGKLLVQLHGREDTKSKRFFKLWINDHHALFDSDIETVLAKPLDAKFLTLLNKVFVEQSKPDKEKKTDNALNYTAAQREKALRQLLNIAEKRNEEDQAKQLRTRIEKVRA